MIHRKSIHRSERRNERGWHRNCNISNTSGKCIDLFMAITTTSTKSYFKVDCIHHSIISNSKKTLFARVTHSSLADRINTNETEQRNSRFALFLLFIEQSKAVSHDCDCDHSFEHVLISDIIVGKECYSLIFCQSWLSEIDVNDLFSSVNQLCTTIQYNDKQMVQRDSTRRRSSKKTCRWRKSPSDDQSLVDKHWYWKRVVFGPT